MSRVYVNKFLGYLFLVMLCELSASFTGYAQAERYRQNAMSSVASGKYEEAIKQFDAEISAYKLEKKENDAKCKEAERLRTAASQCITYNKEGNNNLSGLSDGAIRDRFLKCNGESDFDNRKKDIIEKIDRAKSCYNKVLAAFPTDKVTKDNVRKCDVLRNRVKEYNYSEFQEWNGLHYNSSMERYQSFVQRWPRGIFTEEAKKKLRGLEDYAMWETAETEFSMSAFKKYINEFPNGEHVQEAKRIMEDYEEDLLWADVEQSRDKFQYEDFISRYPNSKHIRSAKTKLNSLEEDQAWADCLNNHTIQAYEQYLSKYPSGVHSRDAMENIDDLAWAKAQKDNTKAAYKAYILTNNSIQRHTKQAKDIISAIERDEDIAADKALWESVAASDKVSDFNRYLGRTGVRNYQKQAESKKALLQARQTDLTVLNSDEISAWYDQAEKYYPLTESDIQKQGKAKEMAAYKAAKQSGTRAMILGFLNEYPDSVYHDEMSDYLAELLAVQIRPTDPKDMRQQFRHAKSYAVSNDTRKYVRSAYMAQLGEYYKMTREPFHTMIDVEVATLGNLVGLGGGYSLGNYRNRLNLEGGIRGFYDFDVDEFIPVLYVQPRVNVIKQTDYNPLSVYIAPELLWGEVEITYSESWKNKYAEYDYAAKVGMGYKAVDLNAGYYFNLGVFSFGLKINF